MRVPTTEETAFAWWRRALWLLANKNGEGLTAKIGDPQCGLYRTRLARNGAWVGVRIYLNQDIDPETGALMDDERMILEINGKVRAPEDIDRWWPFLWQHPISAEEWKYLDSLRQHTETWEPSHPSARPHEPIDPLTSPIPF